MSTLALIILLALVAVVVVGVGALFGVVLIAGKSGRKAQVREMGRRSIA